MIAAACSADLNDLYSLIFMLGVLIFLAFILWLVAR